MTPKSLSPAHLSHLFPNPVPQNTYSRSLPHDLTEIPNSETVYHPHLHLLSCPTRAAPLPGSLFLIHGTTFHPVTHSVTWTTSLILLPPLPAINLTSLCISQVSPLPMAPKTIIVWVGLIISLLITIVTP